MSQTENKGKQSGALLGFLLVVYGVSFIGYLGVRRGLPTWYGSLVHPPGSPAPWIFGPIWTVLYLLIGFAGWQLWRESKSKPQRLALVFYGIQLILNSLWSWLFFGLQRPMG